MTKKAKVTRHISRGVALGILVMGISLAPVIVIWDNNWIPRSRFFNTGHGKTARMAT